MIRKFLFATVAFLVCNFLSSLSASANETHQHRQSNAHVQGLGWPERSPRFAALYSAARFSDPLAAGLLETHDVRIVLAALKAGFFQRAYMDGDVLGEPRNDYSDAAWRQEGLACQFGGHAALEQGNFASAILLFDVARGDFDRAHLPEYFSARTRIDKQLALSMQKGDKFIITQQTINAIAETEITEPVDSILLYSLLEFDAEHRNNKVAKKQAQDKLNSIWKNWHIGNELKKSDLRAVISLIKRPK